VKAERNPSSWLSDALFRDWGTKAIAVLIALTVFVLTRDEVSRSFPVRVNVQMDPTRVLQTSLPAIVDVEVRGPWATVNQLKPTSFRPAEVDLRTLNPGPLEIDPASIVMPEGVVLQRVSYDPVDLRFDDVIERSLHVIPVIVGELHADYERVAEVVDPIEWTVRGPRSKVERLQSLETETLNVGGATETVERSLALLRPGEGLEFVGALSENTARVRVRVLVRPRQGEEEIEVETGALLAAEAPDMQLLGVRDTERVVLSGTVPALGRLAGIEGAVRAEVRVEEYSPPTKRKPSGILRAEIVFGWSEAVPEEVRAAIRFRPPVVRANVTVIPQTEEP
jgi:hypothetical protein